MEDPQIFKALNRLAGHHGRAVVRHQGSGKTPLHDRLTEAMHQMFSGLIQIPLKMADQAGTVIQDPEEDGLRPFS